MQNFLNAACVLRSYLQELPLYVAAVHLYVVLSFCADNELMKFGGCYFKIFKDSPSFNK